MCQYIQLVKAVGNELDVELGGAALRRLSDAAAAAVAAAAARDSLYEQRQQTTALVRTAVSKLRDDRRRAGEMLERCENSLAQLRSASLSTSFGWRKGGNVTSAGWQVRLCYPMWHVSSRSGVTTLRTAIHLLPWRERAATRLSRYRCRMSVTIQKLEMTSSTKRGVHNIVVRGEPSHGHK